MPASKEFFESLKRRLRATKDRAAQDKLLDQWNDTAQMATEYDAKLWGLEQDREIKEILYMMGQHGTGSRTLRRSPPE